MSSQHCSKSDNSTDPAAESLTSTDALNATGNTKFTSSSSESSPRRRNQGKINSRPPDETLPSLSRFGSCCKSDDDPDQQPPSTNSSSPSSNSSNKGGGYWSDEALDDDRSLQSEDGWCHRLRDTAAMKAENVDDSSSMNLCEPPSVNLPVRGMPVQETSIIYSRGTSLGLSSERNRLVRVVWGGSIGLEDDDDDDEDFVVDDGATENDMEDVEEADDSPADADDNQIAGLAGDQDMEDDTADCLLGDDRPPPDTFLQSLVANPTEQVPPQAEAARQANRQAAPQTTAVAEFLRSLRADETILQKIDHSSKFVDGVFEYRFVMLPRNHPFVSLEPEEDVRRRLLTEAEWRILGIKQTRGWQHFGYSRHERNVLLFRRPLGTSPRTGTVSPDVQKLVDRRLHSIEQTQLELMALGNKNASGDLNALPIFGSTNIPEWVPVDGFAGGNSRVAVRRNLIAGTKGKHYIEEPPLGPFFDLRPEDYAVLMQEDSPQEEASEAEATQFVDEVDKLFVAIHMPLFSNF